MIIARSPLRISLGGGGTDLASYYSQRGGFLVAGAINQYVYVSIMKPFEKGIFLKYSTQETVKDPTQIKHPIIRACLCLDRFQTDQIEITTLADIPSGTGLGSSSSFTVALLKALCSFFGQPIHPVELAELACHIEIEILGEPIGKQDQYISAFGGLSQFVFEKDGSVKTSSIAVSRETISQLSQNLLLFYTGIRRSASEILAEQVSKTKTNDLAMLNNLDEVKKIGRLSAKLLSKGRLNEYGELLDTHWKIKLSRSPNMTTEKINETYKYALKSGALGGKIVGAGGGGFLLFYASDPAHLRKAMQKQELEELNFKFDFEGTKILSA